jgi:hypothetical protein
MTDVKILFPYAPSKFSNILAWSLTHFKAIIVHQSSAEASAQNIGEIF